ncbi:MAG: undecaprenyl-phosphate glucose phosphotransferase [Dysgonamonadaceae bacterium]|jgi:Undecaprenyl-phosphate glucose phosphotransferase|nr:undecaprenyl-phosphate glucose phosphotransferase [Dysgonamonadaceae bacterium]
MKEKSLLVVYIIIDLFLLNLSLLIGYYFRWGNSQYLQGNDLHFYILQANLAWIITCFVFVKNNLYLRDAFVHRVYRICRRTILFTGVLMILTFIFMNGHVIRMFIFSYIAIFLVLECVCYWLIYKYMNYRRSRGWNTRRVLLVGYNETSQLFRKMIESTPMLGYQFIGYVKYDTRDINDIPEPERPFVLGNASCLEQIIESNHIQAVFSVFSFFKDKNNIDEQLSICNKTGVRMYLVAESQRWIRKGDGVEPLGDFYVINPQHIPLDETTNRWIKRIFDIVFSSLILLLFSWNLLPIIALAIKLTSKGSVIFSQERTGLNNQPFQCYKFRSMYVNEEADKQQATQNDLRITPFGRFMRRWNLDELPQFYNVLCGQMSIVGPRPHMLSHTEQYSALIRYYKVRHYVKPGVTGWAQVNGLRGETDATWKMEKRVKYDMDYIENWSFLWDMKIICMTIFGKSAWENAG